MGRRASVDAAEQCGILSSGAILFAVQNAGGIRSRRLVMSIGHSSHGCEGPHLDMSRVDDTARGVVRQTDLTCHMPRALTGSRG
jgi:hypothetical protein